MPCSAALPFPHRWNTYTGSTGLGTSTAARVCEQRTQLCCRLAHALHAEPCGLECATAPGPRASGNAVPERACEYTGGTYSPSGNVSCQADLKLYVTAITFPVADLQDGTVGGLSRAPAKALLSASMSFCTQLHFPDASVPVQPLPAAVQSRRPAHPLRYRCPPAARSGHWRRRKGSGSRPPGGACWLSCVAHRRHALTACPGQHFPPPGGSVRGPTLPAPSAA